MKFSNIIILVTLFFASLLFSNCANDHDHTHEEDVHVAHAGHPADEPPAEEHGEEVGLTLEQIQKIGLKMGTFENKNLQSTIKVNGLLELPPQNKASVSSITSGKVLRIAVKPGQYVRKGAVLAMIQNPDLIDWQQEYLEVQGELMFLEKEYVRQKDLVAQEIAPQKQLEQVESNKAIAEAKLKGFASRMKVMGIPLPNSESTDFVSRLTVTSPINGFVRDIKINTGVFVQPEQELFEIVDNHHLHIDFMVYEKDLPFVKKGQKIMFSLQSQPSKVMMANIFAIGKAIDPQNRTVSIHAEIEDEKMELLSGMYVEGRIVTEDRKVPALPEEAVALDKGLHYIFVKEEEHEDEIHFLKVPVLVGATDFGYMEITPMEKLEANAEIVIDGAYFLMAQSKKGEEGAGHHH